MTQTVQLPLWLFVLIVLFAAVTALSHFLLPSVRWFFRRRLERAVTRLNKRLKRPIEPFKLARRYDMIQRLIYDPEVTREIVNYAAKNKVPENVAFQKAESYAREIVPSFSAVYWTRKSDTNDATFDAIPPEATIVFVMNHRSNMDYVLVTYLAARTSALSYAVGEWARVWPLSWLIKSLGAYFIRRRSRGALYRKVMARYVQMATEGGVTQAIYPEGGLSLTVAINYDRVLEDKVLIAAGQRGDRRFGARITVVVRFILNKLWERLRGRVTRFGYAAVAFGTPLLSAELMQRIEQVMPVPVVPMIAQVLLQDAPLGTDDVIARVQALSAGLPQDNLVIDTPALATEVPVALAQLAQREVIRQADDRWHIAQDDRAVLRFYANSIVHFLPPASPSDAAPAKVIAAPAGS